MQQKIIVAVLKKVLRYGYAVDTHLNIVEWLDKLGVPEFEYSQWNKPPPNNPVEIDRGR